MPDDIAIGPAAIKRMATMLYADVGSVKTRLMQQYRSYICPLHEVIHDIPPQSSVLDVGCGHGLLLNLLVHLGRIRRGYGFDMARPAIEIASRVASNHSFSSTVAFEARSVEKGIPHLGYEVVTVIDVLHHIPDSHKQSFVEALCSALPEGGAPHHQGHGRQATLARDRQPASRSCHGQAMGRTNGTGEG